MRSRQFVGQLYNERDWEEARRPYYNVWPSIVGMDRSGQIGASGGAQERECGASGSCGESAEWV